MLPTGIGWAASVFVLVDGMTDWSCALRGLRVARVMVPMAMPKRIFVRPLTLGHAIACYLDVELKFVRIHLGISARRRRILFLQLLSSWPCLKSRHRLRCLKTCGLRFSDVQLHYMLKSQQTSASLRITTLKACKHPSHSSTIDHQKSNLTAHTTEDRPSVLQYERKAKRCSANHSPKHRRPKATPNPLQASDIPCRTTQPGYSGKRLSG